MEFSGTSFQMCFFITGFISKGLYQGGLIMAEDPVLLVRQEGKKGDNRTGRGQDVLLEQFNNLNEKTQVAQEQE